jgi:hypothetical protein
MPSALLCDCDCPMWGRACLSTLPTISAAEAGHEAACAGDLAAATLDHYVVWHLGQDGSCGPGGARLSVSTAGQRQGGVEVSHAKCSARL